MRDREIFVFWAGVVVTLLAILAMEPLLVWSIRSGEWGWTVVVGPLIALLLYVTVVAWRGAYRR